MKTFGKKYYLGLDLGTNSVGWALTDENYNLRRIKGKDAWGARLFDEAKTSVERRTHRSSRRRSQREKAREGYLREVFAKEIEKVDPAFYQRLEESKYHFDDRSENNRQKYALFTGDYTDRNYYDEYPTIFHLRKALIDNEKAPYDVRLVFLALLNMFKHRGNFLNSSLEVSGEASGMTEVWDEFVTEAEMYSFEFKHDSFDKVAEVLSEKGVAKSIIAEKLCEALDITKKNKPEYELIGLMAGKTGKLINIYGDETMGDSKLFISFRDTNFDEKADEIHTVLGDEYFRLIEAAKAVHDMGLLSNIMKGHKYLTYARVESYEQHKADLKELKSVLMRYDMKLYNKMFRIMADGNYSAYVGSVYSHDYRQRRNCGNGRKQEDLYKTIKSMLVKLPGDDPEVADIISKIDAEVFMPKQLTSANGVIPNQVYVAEMKAILKNAEGYLPFLKEKDESGLTVSERIIQLFSFRVPYYVGPIGQEYADRPGYNVWSVRKESGRVFPWNFDKKIDANETAEKFILRMVRKCSYLCEENTLPKCSLLYEKYMVLNELNTLKVYGEPISVEDKQDIYNKLFLKGKKLKIKDLEKYFINRGKVEAGAEGFLSGIDTEGGFNTSLSTYGKFYSVFGKDINRDDVRSMVEKIVFWMTVYGDDKELIKSRIEENYGTALTQEQKKRILSFKFKDWGKLSKEFLETTGTERSDERSIISMLWETNNNLMELLSERYSYADAIKNKTNIAEKALSEWSVEDLDELYLSAPVKRMVWQTMKIMNELTEITGRSPERIFVEMPREDGEKSKRTSSRKQHLVDLYSKLKKEGKVWKDEIEARPEADFKIKKLYLYYLQQGKCMYSDEQIVLHTLLNDNTMYDIDHIYPRHFVKDDSIENNLVLVKKQINQNEKKDIYPIGADIQNKCRSLWERLAKNGFISKEKYNRLIRKETFSEEEKAGFISRQLVETRQGTKAITQIIKQAFPEATVVFSKAGEVSDFRKKYDILKVRRVNDLHHAKDAYLNIVVGNTYFVKFTANPLNYIKESSKKQQDPLYKYNMDKIFQYDVKRGDETAWIGTKSGSSETLNTVIKTMQRNTVLITKRSYIYYGSFTESDTVYSAKKAKGNPNAYVAMSSDPILNDVCRYGGRTSASVMCYCLVEYKLNNKIVRSIEALPITLGHISKITDETIAEYLTGLLRKEAGSKVVTDVCLKYRCIRLNSLIKLDGHYYHLRGKSLARICLKNAVPLFLSKKDESYIRQIEKAQKLGDYDLKETKLNLAISCENNNSLFDNLCSKIKNTYSNKKTNIFDVLNNNIDKFRDISIKDQIYTLLQIVDWLNLDCVAVDLSRMGGASNAGYCKVGKRISNCSEAILINQSVTGLFESQVDLLSI